MPPPKPKCWSSSRARPNPVGIEAVRIEAVRIAYVLGIAATGREHQHGRAPRRDGGAGDIDIVEGVPVGPELHWWLARSSSAQDLSPIAGSSPPTATRAGQAMLGTPTDLISGAELGGPEGRHGEVRPAVGLAADHVVGELGLRDRVAPVPEGEELVPEHWLRGAGDVPGDEDVGGDQAVDVEGAATRSAESPVLPTCDPVRAGGITRNG
jgi:hypothetical protein